MTPAQNIKIKINGEYEKLVPELSENDLQLLRASIKADNAVHTPIFVNQEGTILDGHHRWRIIQELGIRAYETTVKHFEEPIFPRTISAKNQSEGRSGQHQTYSNQFQELRQFFLLLQS
jgi:predicted metal-dependent phosphotriesterase family hydrolase